MSKLEDFYNSQAKAEQEIETKRRRNNRDAWNSAAAVMKEVIIEIKKREEVQHPETCEWIELDKNKKPAWKFHGYSHYNTGAKYYYLLDGIIVNNESIPPSVYNLEPSDPISFPDYPEETVKMKEALIKFAEKNFGVKPKDSWNRH